MKRRDLYPVYLDLRHRLVVVVGGGSVAERKTLGLIACGAEVRVVAPTVTAALEDMARRRAIEWIRREFDGEDLRGAHLAFAATNNPVVNTRVCQACDWQGVLVNRVESPEASDFIVPSTLRRGGLTIAVSTAGASPHLARRIRQSLEERFGDEYAAWIDLLEKARRTVIDAIADPQRRSDLLKRLADDDALLETLRSEGADAAWAHLERIIAADDDGSVHGEDPSPDRPDLP